MRFTSPALLILLLLVPLFAWMGWPPAGSGAGRLKDPFRRQAFLALGLRLGLVLCLVLALAGLQFVRRGDDLAVVFLVDVSDSLPPEAVAAELDYLHTALQAMGPDDQAAVVLFGADALVERPMLPGGEIQAITSAPTTTGTDLAGAIRLGLALFPSGSARRMVVLSDGGQTSGDAFQAADLAASLDVQIVAVPIGSSLNPEAMVTAVDAPTELRPGEQFNLDVSIQASEPLPATVRVLVGDRIVYEEAHQLRRGIQTLSLPLTAGAPGFVRYQVQIAPQPDGFYQNNRLDTFSQVQGPPRLLVVAPPSGEVLPGGDARPDEAAALMQVLRSAGDEVRLVPPAALPSDLPGLAQYNAVILVDVPARQLGDNQMRALQSYVRELGGGLVCIGGPTSYAVGGYYQTPLEETLPLEMLIRDEARRPTLAIVFIIDHSGSMSETSSGVEKVELAKAAVARSLELLFPTDRVGVIAFDDVASWVVPMTDLADPSAVIQAIGTIRSGGGTDILAGLQAMADVLPGESAMVKHVILLTDGGADPAGIAELVERMNADYGITLSTVGVGRDAAPFLEGLAQIGQGRYHFTADPSTIPTIFTEETSLASRGYIVEEPFFPALVATSPILAGIQSVPQLYGYVASSPKDLAQVILESGRGDPILAAWQYGLGRAVAFTSDATGRWARDWVAWQGFPTFWLQAVQYTLGDAQEAAIQTRVDIRDGMARISLDARSQTGELLNGYTVEANVISPAGGSQPVTLRQVAPGRYEGSFVPSAQGVYLVRLTGSAGEQGQAGFSRTLGWTMSYSPEYRQLGSDPDLLYRLAVRTGGRIAGANPADAFIHDLESARASRPAWPWLLLAAGLLLPLDIAARRLIVTSRDLAQLRAAIAARLSARAGRAAAGSTAPSPRMQALLKTKDRVRAQAPAPSQTVHSSGIIQRIDAARQPDEKPVPEPDPAEKPASPSEKEPGASTAHILLTRKRKR